MNRRTLTWFAAGAILLAAGMTGAQPFDVPPGKWWERPKLVEQLGLAPDQVQRLNGSTYDHARTMIDLKATVDRATLDLRAAAEAAPFEPAKVRQAFVVLQQARNRLESERFDMLLKVRDVLTADQWRKLQTMVRERRAEKAGDAAPTPGEAQRRNQQRRWR